MKPIEEMGKCGIFWMGFWTQSAQLEKQGSQPIIATNSRYEVELGDERLHCDVECADEHVRIKHPI